MHVQGWDHYGRSPHCNARYAVPDDDLPIPLEIPWRLAATTQRLREGFPEDTTISMFVYEPRTATLDADYPDERLVFLKFTVSVSPVALEGSELPDWIRSQFVGGLPVLHMVLDLGVTPEPFAVGGIRPYFHAASPLRRAMVETGVIGRQVFEGESNSVSVGRSASQLFETVGSKVTTQKVGGSVGLPGIFNADASYSETTVDSERNAKQYQETTNRNASTERRELLSHLTHVENLLTLLNAKHVGSPFLRFALSPRPLAAPADDVGDAQRWIRALLQHRSTGIDGIQEFITVVAVPRGQRFCVQAQLRRFAVLDDPPQPPVFPRTSVAPEEIAPLIDYLYSKYPVGTPLDALDVDVTEQFEDTEMVPALLLWALVNPHVAVGMGDYASLANLDIDEIYRNDGFIYKPSTEVRRDMLVDRYLAELVQSPLERGVVVMRSTQLRTCFRNGAAGLGPASFGVDTTPPQEFGFTPGDSRPQGPRLAAAEDGSEPAAVANQWAALDVQLAQQAAAAPRAAGEVLGLNSEAVLEMLLRRWSRLGAGDRHNLNFERAAASLGLSAVSSRALRAAGATDLASIARALIAAPLGERINRDLAVQREALPKRVLCKFDLQPISGLLPLTIAKQVRAEISRASKPPTKRPKAQRRAG